MTDPEVVRAEIVLRGFSPEVAALELERRRVAERLGGLLARLAPIPPRDEALALIVAVRGSLRRQAELGQLLADNGYPWWAL